jgi:hypothetical protein
MNRVIIMAQGRQTRFGSDKPKCLTEITPGETLLDHTLWLLNSNVTGGWDTPLVIGWPSLEEATAHKLCRLHTLTNPGYCILDGLALTQLLWGPAQTTILLGDVAYSRATIMKLLAPCKSILFAGTEDLSAGGGEIFGFTFTKRAQTFVAQRLMQAPCRLSSVKVGQPGHLRYLLRDIMESWGLHPKPQHYYADNLYCVIDDWTTDFDVPEDLEKLPRVARHIAKERANDE